MNKIGIIFVITLLILGIVLGMGYFETGNAIQEDIQNVDGEGKISLKVNIPCSGHSYLIIQSLEKLGGVESVDFRIPYYFDVVYNPKTINENQILDAEIFKAYSARRAR